MASLKGSGLLTSFRSFFPSRSKSTKLNTVRLGSSRRFFAVSPSFLKKYKSFLFPLFRVIVRNRKLLEKGGRIESGGFVISSPRSTGSQKGSENLLRLKVSHDGKLFFVKMGKHTASDTHSAYELAEELFSSLNHRIGGFKLRQLNYHLLYNPKEYSDLKGSKRGFLVSDFVNEDEYDLLSDLAERRGPRWSESKEYSAFEELRRLCLSKGIYDLVPKNIFFNPRTKTFLVFDLRILPGES